MVSLLITIYQPGIKCNRDLMVSLLITNLLTGNKVQLHFTEMNSRYFKHCNGIFVNNYFINRE